MVGIYINFDLQILKKIEIIIRDRILLTVGDYI